MGKNLVYFLVFETPEPGGWRADDYLAQLALCLRSLRRTSDPTSFDVLFVADRASAARIRELPELDGFTHTTRLFAVPPSLCLAMCTRYMIHPLLGADLAKYEKILYLDVDIIVRHDVARLFERVTDPQRLYVKPDHWGGARIDCEWYALPGHTEEEARRFVAENVLVFNSGQFAFVNGPPMRALFGELCAALPALWPTSPELDQPVFNSFARRRHLAAPCLDYQALDPLVHLDDEGKAPIAGEAVLVHFIKGNKVARMREALGPSSGGPKLTFITTCRGRLTHLKETLPALVSQPDTECVVVDYGCPERAGDWVTRHFPSARVVRSPEATRFEIARARNLGAAAAKSPWLCFIDADIRVAPDFAEKVVPLLAPGRYFQATPRNLETWGTSISARDDFERIGGYDEVIQGWGKDDDDFYARLELGGVRPSSFPGELIRAIPHGDAARVGHYDVKNRWLSESINHVYCRAKIDLSLLRRAPVSLELRRQLYEQVRAVVASAHASGEAAQVTLVLNTEETRLCGPLEARLVYTLPRPAGTGAPNPNAGSVVHRPW